MKTTPQELSTEAVQQLVAHFGDLHDPRRVERCDHLRVDILVIAILAVICGTNDCEALAEFGLARQDTGCAPFWPCPTGFPRTIPSIAC